MALQTRLDARWQSPSSYYKQQAGFIGRLTTGTVGQTPCQLTLGLSTCISGGDVAQYHVD